MTEVVVKKKKKTDFVLLRKLEDEYDEAVEDAERREEILIKKVHNEYLNAVNKGLFFEKLQKSESWYYQKFQFHDLELVRPKHSEGIKQAHQERKVQSIISDLEEMESDIEQKPRVEIDEELIEDEEYIDPYEQEKDWIHRTKIELQSEPPKKITTDSNFGKYQETKGMIVKTRDLQYSDFKVSEKYKTILLHQLDKTIDYLMELRRRLNEEKN